MAEQSHDIEQMMAEINNLRLLIDNTDDPIWMVDTSYAIIECNNAFKTWVRHFIGKELCKGDHVLDNGSDMSYHAKFEMCYTLALSGRNFRTVEDMRIGTDLHYTSVSFNPVLDDKGAIIAVSCFAKDITEHRQHLRRIEQQNAALREIAFIESHKIRGPVVTILGLEQFYNYNDLTDPFNKEIMENVKKVSLELDGIIREVVRRSNEIV